MDYWIFGSTNMPKHIGRVWRVAFLGGRRWSVEESYGDWDLWNRKRVFDSRRAAMKHVEDWFKGILDEEA